MKKIIILIITILLITGCSETSYDYENPVDDYEDYCETEYDPFEMAMEAINEVDYENYCTTISTTNETECLETFRDDVTSHVSEAFVDVDDVCENEYGYSDIAIEAINEVDYENYCTAIGATNETECLETFKDDVISHVSKAFENLY